MIDQDDNRDIIQSMIQAVPLQRLAEPDEITNLVVYLASDDPVFQLHPSLLLMVA